MPGAGNDVLTSMAVRIHTPKSRFSGAVQDGAITLEGSVRGGQAFITKIGKFDVELAAQVRLPAFLASGAHFFSDLVKVMVHEAQPLGPNLGDAMDWLIVALHGWCNQARP